MRGEQRLDAGFDGHDRNGDSVRQRIEALGTSRRIALKTDWLPEWDHQRIVEEP
jgi:hypothetical protein